MIKFLKQIDLLLIGGVHGMAEPGGVSLEMFHLTFHGGYPFVLTDIG